MTGPVPDISVIVIVYNDAERLPVAVNSVLNQPKSNLEAVIVDDASTDTSFEVALRLASENPNRVRAVRLEENSGACGRPRNVGLRHVRGEYVMFLDSDDTLERHACQTMYSTAVKTQADFVSGLCVQVVSGAKGE